MGGGEEAIAFGMRTTIPAACEETSMMQVSDIFPRALIPQ